MDSIECLQRDLREIRMDILEGLAIPHSLSLAICLRYKQWDEISLLFKMTDTMICSSKEVPSRTINYERAFLQANALFSKSDDLYTTEQLHEKAIVSFFECEEKNRITNTRFLLNEVSSPLIYTTAMLIQQSLGAFSELDWAQNFRFGPGASSTCRGVQATIVGKLSSQISCTPRALEPMERGLRHFFQYYHVNSAYSVEPWNYFLTVPKDSLRKRPIAIAQHGNMIGQLALGTLLKHRFDRTHRIDQAAHHHGMLVRRNWKSIATIDLSNASQLIARRAVQSVFPTDWLEMMDNLREEYTYIPNSGDIHTTDRLNYNQHYSAMGNGFTFEMETILFYSVCKAAMLNAGVKWNVLSVFGDDIIVDKEHAQIVISALEDFGFEINRSKTFIEGPFRESCGVDTLYGTNVRPIYIRNYTNENKKLIELRYRLTNTIFRIATNSGHGLCVDASFYRPWKRSLAGIPAEKRYFGHSSEVCKHGKVSYDDTVLAYAATRQQEGFYHKHRLGIRVRRRDRVRATTGVIQLGSALLGAPADGIIPRGAPYQVKVEKLWYTGQRSTIVWA